MGTRAALPLLHLPLLTATARLPACLPACLLACLPACPLPAACRLLPAACPSSLFLMD